MINAIIDDIQVTVPEHTTILKAAEMIGIKIPTLCFHPDQEIKANCRICVCDVEGLHILQTACSTPLKEGMVVHTRTARVLEARRVILQLILARHPQDCLNCIRNKNCELQNLSDEFGIRENIFEHTTRNLPKDKSTHSIIRDPDKCILCRRCEYVCTNIQSVGVLGMEKRGKFSIIVPTMGKELLESTCVMCGQCIHACPVGAIYENEQTEDFLAAVADPKKIVVAQIAPAVRVAISEELGMATGELDMHLLIAALRKIGVDYVLHTNFTADLTIIEEGNELIHRLKEGGTLPMFTSCSPAWINYCETFYPQLLDNLSTCKSPQQMFGALAKTYWAEKTNIDPSKIFSVSIMPCTAKKHEANRPEMQSSGYQDVDLVLTTRELGRLIRMFGIDFSKLKPSNFDPWMGCYTGAGVIFGATGGVMEAALRTVYEVVTGKELENVNLTFARGMEGIKEAEIDLNGIKIRVAIAHGLGNAKQLMDEVQKGNSPYHFIEIMACPGGCIGGGGQPITRDNTKREERIGQIYLEDEGLLLRKSHLNPEVDIIYKEFLQKPLGEKSHELLHTHYTSNGKNRI